MIYGLSGVTNSGFVQTTPAGTVTMNRSGYLTSLHYATGYDRAQTISLSGSAWSGDVLVRDRA